MNSSIAAASLLGFGDKPASTALAEFGNTLAKIYDVQEKQLKEEESSRKSLTDEYNKEQRSRKKRESDLVELLSGGKKQGGRAKSGAKKKGGMSLVSKILLGAGVALAGKALYDAVSDNIFEGVKDTVEEMVDPILDAFGEAFAPVRNFFGGGDGDDGGNTSSGSTGDTNRTSPPAPEDSDAGFKRIYNIARDAGDPFPEVTAAQWALESGWGSVESGKNNYFGQKAQPNEPGSWHTTQEWRNGRYVTEQARFKDYANEGDAIKERLAKWKYKYSSAKTAEEAVKRLQITGGQAIPGSNQTSHGVYATDPKYVSKITDIISRQGIDPRRQKLAKGGEVGKKKRKKRPGDRPRKGNGPETEQSIAFKPLKKQKGGKIFLHWAATGYDFSSPKYHATIQGDGTVAKERDYNSFGGGHTSGRNSEGIGISLAAMSDATDKDFGTHPVKKIQYENMAKLCAQVLKSWGHGPSYVNATNVQTHAEAANIGDAKGGYGPLTTTYIPSGDYRWDLWKLYENDADGSGGPKIRNMIKGYMSGGGNIELESEDVGAIPQSSGSTGATPGGVRPSGPKLPPPPKTLDDAISQVAGEALAPIIGLFGALSGNPVQYDMPGAGADAINNGAQSTGPGRAGAASINDPNARALLNAIADVEGTSGHPNNGYNTIFSGKQFNNLSDHPRQDIPFGNTTSDAAGRYQFLSTTWDGYAKGRDMSPANQDAVALDLVAVKQGVNIADGLSKQEVYKLGREWASIEGGPTGIPGGSYSGQAKYSAEEFMDIYKSYGGKVQGLQKGGMVGSQINTGGMRGMNNARMSKLREQQQRMKRRGPRVIQVPLPVIPTSRPPQMSEGGGGGDGFIGHEMVMSQLADFNRRLSMGALA